MPHWNSGDDAKLASLFRRGRKNGGLDPRNLSKEYIENEVIAKHWPGKKYSSFRPTYILKAREWNVGKTLGGRRKKNNNSPAPAPAAAMETQETEEAEVTEEASDEEQAAAEDNTNPQDGEIEDDDVAELTEEINSMSVHMPSTKNKTTGSAKSHSLNFEFPYLQYNYIDGRHHRLTLDFIVVRMAWKCFRPAVKNGGKTFSLRVALPGLFTSQDRIQITHEGQDPNQEFNESTHKATAFEESAGKITDRLAVGEELLSEPQDVTLPFIVEEEIDSWEVQAFDNEDEEFARLIAGDDWPEDVEPPPQKYFVLTVKLTGKKVRKQHTQGAMRVFGSPTRRNRNQAAANNNNARPAANNNNVDMVDEDF